MAGARRADPGSWLSEFHRIIRATHCTDYHTRRILDSRFQLDLGIGTMDHGAPTLSLGRERDSPNGYRT
ncbi:MAG: hypothetical protein VCC04_00275, partial [Myxococcota bacterium]